MITPQQTAQIAQVLKANAPTPSGGGSGGGWYSQVTQSQPATQTASQPTKTQTASPISSDVQDAGTQLNSDMSDTSTNPLEKGVRASSDVATGVTNVAADVIPGGKTALGAVGKVAGAGVDAAGNIGNTLADLATKVHLMSPEQKAAYDKANSDFASSDSGKNISQIATDLAAAGNTAGTILGAEGGATAGDKAVGLAKTGTGAIKDAATSALKSDPVAQAAQKTAKDAATLKANIADATQRATPDYESMNPTQKANLRTQPAINGKERVPENTNVFGKRTPTPNAVETAGGTELGSIKGYKPSMTNLQVYHLGTSEVAKAENALMSSVEGEKVILPKKEMVSTVKKAVDAVTQKSLILTNADPYIKQYIRVTENAAKELPGTVKGVITLRRALDSAYKNARGRLAFSPDKLSSLDEIHEAGRDALNQKAISSAKNTDVAASFQKQFHILKALDEVGRRADREGGSGVARFMQQHPALVKGAKTVARTAGLGAIVHVAE